MLMNLICGLIGMALVLAFLGIMVWWVPAPPLILIIAGVMAMMVYDFFKTIRHGENGPGR